jgi:hypothetical protein
MELLELRDDRTTGERTSMELPKDYERIGHRSILEDKAVRLHEGATLGPR